MVARAAGASIGLSGLRIRTADRPPTQTTLTSVRQRPPQEVQEYPPPPQLLYTSSSMRAAPPEPSASIADATTDPSPYVRSAIRAPSGDHASSPAQTKSRLTHGAAGGLPISVGGDPSIGA